MYIYHKYKAGQIYAMHVLADTDAMDFSLMKHLTLSVRQRDQVELHFKTASSQQSFDLNCSYDSGWWLIA